MRVTEVKIYMSRDQKDTIKAYCSIALDNEFVVKDIRVIELDTGLMISMPNRKITLKCYYCESKNVFTARYCSNCGERFEERVPEGTRLYSDIAYPMTPSCRQHIEDVVLAAYKEKANELENSNIAVNC